jgi:hypothetical protein
VPLGLPTAEMTTATDECNFLFEPDLGVLHGKRSGHFAIQLARNRSGASQPVDIELKAVFQAHALKRRRAIGKFPR